MLNIFLGAVTIFICIPLILGWIPPNRWYGVRFPESFTSNENWYRINRLGGALLAIWGVTMIGYGVFAQLSGRPALHLLGLAVMMGSLLAMVIGLAIYVNQKHGNGSPPCRKEEKPS